jgi:hypothetical protein
MLKSPKTLLLGLKFMKVMIHGLLVESFNNPITFLAKLLKHCLTYSKQISRGEFTKKVNKIKVWILMI